MFIIITVFRALTTFKLEGEVTSLSGSTQGEVEDWMYRMNRRGRALD
jgi:hypothetical protein